jgi:phosphate transport system permease protein
MESRPASQAASAPPKSAAVPFRREKKARRGVLIADAIADRTITIGGILVILAVLGILVFLVAETFPLFRSGTATATHTYSLEGPADDVIGASVDDYKTLAFLLTKEGKGRLFHARTGLPLQQSALDFEGRILTALATTPDRKYVVFGFSDGSVRFGSLEFSTEILPPEKLPQGLTKVDEQDSADGSSVYRKIPGNQFRKVSFSLTMDKEFIPASESGKPLVALAYHVSGQAERQARAFVALDQDGIPSLNLVTSKINLLTGERRAQVSRTQLPPLPQGVKPQSILLTEKADQVMVADKSGTVYRYNTADLNAPVLAETVRLVPDSSTLTAVGFLLGGQSLVVGGSDGSLNIFFLLKKEGAATKDGQALQLTRSFDRLPSSPVLFEPAVMGKNFAVADAKGNLFVFHGTSQKLLVQFPPDSKTGGYRTVLLSPRMDGLMALQADGRVRLWEFSVPHPETTVRTLFRKVWYEGYPEPTYTWQSSAMSEDYEPKLSLIPLIFGTIKAAFYSLLFAIPIAILGAIYTSEFVNIRVRAVVKPTMEMMASLPSVVLGFVAALVMAPVVETWIAAVLLVFMVVPASLMIAAYLWQMIPLRIALRIQGSPKFFATVLVVICAIYGAVKLGDAFEAVFFSGDFKAWVNGDVGGPEPMLFLLALPLAFLIVSVLVSRLYGRKLALVMKGMSQFKAALLELGRWGGTVLLAALGSLAIAKILALLGMDVRGTFVDTYVQRNTLIVGFAMGFAVIPIIYTIAEDALNAVPEHLRAASLGCGATPWQTAIYVVLPTAVSGVFSAIMIGMGRAVGETMIVVMATGNTPIIDMNIFNGLRALSATIAVELPEAVKDGTLYRILFLSGLVLFAMTFVINTVAEVIRLRFRKRAMQL